LKLNALGISTGFTGLAIFVVVMFSSFGSDEGLEHQRQANTLIEQAVTNKPLEPKLITELVLSQDDPITYAEFSQHLPTSLLNTPKPERLELNSDGSLLINKKILHLFEFYLSAIGEESLEIIVTRIKNNLREQLTAKALNEAIHILEGYLQYRNKVTALKQEYNQRYGSADYSIEHVINAKNELIDVRWHYLSGEVITAFFEQEDVYENYMLNLTAIVKDKRLSKEQQDNALSVLNAQTPNWLIEQQNAANQLNKYRQQYSELISQGVSNSELRAFTEQEFNAEASDRLSQLESDRRRWRQRLSEYRVELDIILVIESDRSAQQALINQLRNQYFNTQEIKRVSVLDARYLSNVAKG
jgi:lipase chaperone LimK